MSFNELSSHDQPGVAADSSSSHRSLHHTLSRRQLMRLGLTATGVVGLAASGLLDGTSVYAATATTGGNTPTAASVNSALSNAYCFQDIMMDAYASGSTLRLSQSYSDQAGLFSTAFTYDNALAIIAYLRRPGGTARAKLLGDSLLYAQQHDPFNDGRLRQAYFVNPFILPDGSVNLVGDPFNFLGSAVGDLAWAGLALAHLYDRTHELKYLEGALFLAAWINQHTYDTRGAGGYTLGVDAWQNVLTKKSTEHNIDVYAFFGALAKLTQDPIWKQRAAHALTFIQAMWNAQDGHFWTGSQDDGVTINTTVIPEDVQTWSYLALRDKKYACSIDWVLKHVTATDTASATNSVLTGSESFTGATFSDLSLAQPPVNVPPYDPAPDPHAVWFEGTGHLVTALSERTAKGDSATRMFYLGNIIQGQSQLGKGQTANKVAIPEGLGVVSSSSPLNTGFGFGYNSYLHIGATAWLCLAAVRQNPYSV